MFAVIFEVEPRAEHFDRYLVLAASLRAELERIDGFIDNRRYRSRTRPGWMVSLSFWRDEKALIRWRTHAGHHAVQAQGRAGIFARYHLRIGEVFAENAAPSPPTRTDETATGAARAVSLIEAPDMDAPPETTGLVGWDMFDGITIPGTRLKLLFWADRAACETWTPTGGERRRDVRVIRDYSLTDRREAPQYFPPYFPLAG